VETKEALGIIRLLADGVDPVSGEKNNLWLIVLSERIAQRV